MLSTVEQRYDVRFSGHVKCQKGGSMGPASRPDKQQGCLLQNVYTAALQHTDGTANADREKYLNAHNRKIYLIWYVWRRTTYNLHESSIKMHI